MLLFYPEDLGGSAAPALVARWGLLPGWLGVDCRSFAEKWV